jgi:hypothetical protein
MSPVIPNPSYPSLSEEASSSIGVLESFCVAVAFVAIAAVVVNFLLLPVATI